jgi:hypothetical protein
MRISRTKVEPGSMKLTSDDVEASIAGRRRELAALIQAGLKVGADLSAREAGRRAFTEFMKLEPAAQPPGAVAVGTSGQLIFTAAKRKRIRSAAI